MKKDILKNSLIVVIVLGVILAFSFLESIVNKLDFIKSFEVVLSTMIREFWKFISNPTIFLCITAAFLIWKFRQSIESVFPNLKEVKAGMVTASFEPLPPQGTSYEKNIKSTHKDTSINQKISEDNASDVYIINILGKKSCHFYIDIDGKALTKAALLREIEEREMFSSQLKTDDPTKRNLYFNGVFNVLWSYFVFRLFTVDLSDDNKTAHFNLKPGTREKLNDRLKYLEQKSSDKSTP